jgi:DNA-binding Lrp family transcriptional regulator
MRDNSRKSLKEVSKLTNIPASTLYDALARVETGNILRHVSLVDFFKLGYGLRASFIMSSKNKKEMQDFLMQSHSINTLSALSGDHDFFAECVFKDFNEYALFKDKLDQIGLKTFTENFVLEELKKEGFKL